MSHGGDRRAAAAAPLVGPAGGRSGELGLARLPELAVELVFRALDGRPLADAAPRSFPPEEGASWVLATACRRLCALWRASVGTLCVDDHVRTRAGASEYEGLLRGALTRFPAVSCVDVRGSAHFDFSFFHFEWYHSGDVFSYDYSCYVAVKDGGGEVLREAADEHPPLGEALLGGSRAGRRDAARRIKRIVFRPHEASSRLGGGEHISGEQEAWAVSRHRSEAKTRTFRSCAPLPAALVGTYFGHDPMRPTEDVPLGERSDDGWFVSFPSVREVDAGAIDAYLCRSRDDAAAPWATLVSVRSSAKHACDSLVEASFPLYRATRDEFFLALSRLRRLRKLELSLEDSPPTLELSALAELGSLTLRGCCEVGALRLEDLPPSVRTVEVTSRRVRHRAASVWAEWEAALWKLGPRWSFALVPRPELRPPPDDDGEVRTYVLRAADACL
jgi:hypothetical protein